LTLRSVLPGNPLVPRVVPAEKDEGQWHVKGLPQPGFPYALATTSIRPDAKQPRLHADVLKVDPRTVRIAAKKAEDEKKTVLSIGGAKPASKGAPSLWLAPGSFAIGTESPGPGAIALLSGEALTERSLAEATAIIGITDEDGTLVYVRTEQAGAAASKALLGQLGCSQTMIVSKAVVFRLGGGLDLHGELAKEPLLPPIVVLERADAPAARELFPDTPVVPPGTWQPLQAKRVRYFGRKPAPAPSGGPGPAPASSGAM